MGVRGVFRIDMCTYHNYMQPPATMDGRESVGS